MAVSHFFRLLFIAALALFGVAPSLALAQDATPVAGDSGDIVATGLTTPRRMTWGADGTLFVALAGSGGANAATEAAPTDNAVGPWTGGPTAAVVQIGADTCPVAVATGLPSSIDSVGGVLGADDVAILGGQLYVAVDGGGPVHGNPDQPSGIYRVYADGTSELVADLSAWVRTNPVAELPGDLDPDAAGYSVVADEAAGMLWVGDPNSGQILSVTPDGEVVRIADLSVGHPVPTKLALDPNGGVYVGTLTVVPYADGTASVMHIAADGTVTDVWTNLTTVTDVAVGPDGTLYALEMSTGNTAEPPFLVPGSGQLVRQISPDTSEVVAGGLTFPIALDIGLDGAFYVASPALGANDGSGVITRYDVTGAGNPMMGDLVASACTPIPETLSAPAATPTVTETQVATGVATETQAAPASATVTIADFAFAPASLEIAAGTTVTWTNNDSAPHTATADDGSWDTGNLDAGASASVTFDTPGTYTYHCAYHPNMTATIVVT